jgi:hypothetical protein
VGHIVSWCSLPVPSLELTDLSASGPIYVDDACLLPKAPIAHPLSIHWRLEPWTDEAAQRLQSWRQSGRLTRLVLARPPRLELRALVTAFAQLASQAPDISLGLHLPTVGWTAAAVLVQQFPTVSLVIDEPTAPAPLVGLAAWLQRPLTVCDVTGRKIPWHEPYQHAPTPQALFARVYDMLPHEGLD